LIVLSLDGVMYNEDMALAVFKSMGFHKKGEAPAAAASSSSSSNRWETRPVQPAKKKAKEKKIKTTTPAAASQPIPSIQPSQPIPSIQPSQPIPSVQPSFSEASSSFEVSFADLDAKFKSAAGNDSLFQSLTPSQGSNLLGKMTSAAESSVQKMFAQHNNMPSIDSMKSTAGSSLPITGSYKVPFKNQAVGPNQAMAKGSNASLLRAGSMQPVVMRGANSNLSLGAQKAQANGPSKDALRSKGTSKGADASLRVGANASLARGPISVRAA